MYGTLAGALAGREIPFDRNTFTATADGRIVGTAGVGKPIRIESIRVHYSFAVPPEAREPTERALALHPRGCPAHESVKEAIKVTWDATVKIGYETIIYRSEELREELPG
jgi:hypothetical protein